MKTYEIWSEGYMAQGGNNTAIYHGTEAGKSFKDACRNFAKKNPDFKSCFDSKDMTLWGCRLFDNESDARSYFG